MGRDEPLKGLHSSQPLHGAFPSSEGQVAVLCAIVEPAAYFLSISVSQLLHRRTIGAETVRDNDARGAVTLQRFLQELQRRGLVPPRGHEGFRHLALRVDRVPEVAAFTVHAHEDLVQMPTPVGVLAQGLDRERIVEANIGPNRFTQNRAVSWQMSMPRSKARSSTFRSDKGKRTYSITTIWITSGE